MPAPRFTPAERRITAEAMQKDYYPPTSMTLQAIAQKYGVSYGLVQNMLREVGTVMRGRGAPGARFKY